MTRSRDIADQQENLGGAVAPFVGAKNRIINGDFSQWQRGASFAPSTGVVTYTADRWRVVVPSGTTISRQTFTPGTAPVEGYEGQYYYNAVITANAQNYEYGQFIENARTLAGQTVTLSFWARSTVGAQPLNAALYQNFGTGGSPSSLVQVGVTTYTPTSSWQRFTFTYSVPSVAGKTFGTNNDSYLWVRTAQYTTTATNTSVDIWGVQLEAGSQATPFTPAGGGFPGAELALCQRYYVRYLVQDGYAPINSYGVGFSSTGVQAVMSVPVTMRTNIASVDASGVIFQDVATGSNFGYTSLSLNRASDKSAQLLFTGMSGITNYRQYTIYGNGNSAAYLGFSAEL